MKRITALLMIAALAVGVVSLTACGDKQEQKPADSTIAVTEAATAVLTR